MSYAIGTEKIFTRPTAKHTILSVTKNIITDLKKKCNSYFKKQVDKRKNKRYCFNV